MGGAAILHLKVRCSWEGAFGGLGGAAPPMGGGAILHLEMECALGWRELLPRAGGAILNLEVECVLWEVPSQGLAGAAPAGGISSQDASSLEILGARMHPGWRLWEPPPRGNGWPVPPHARREDGHPSPGDGWPAPPHARREEFHLKGWRELLPRAGGAILNLEVECVLWEGPSQGLAGAAPAGGRSDFES